MPHRHAFYTVGVLLLTAPLTRAEPRPLHERYRLDIRERVISRSTLEAGSRIQFGQGPLRCQAGVSLHARAIEVRLQGIEADVHFRVIKPDIPRVRSKALKTTGR